MIEIPEGKNLEKQAVISLTAKKIEKVYTLENYSKFCWFYGDPNNYEKLLKGKVVIGAKGHGMYLDIYMDKASLSIGDGASVRLCAPHDKRPDKYQLMIDFDDGYYLVFNIAMYGGIWAYENLFDNAYHSGSLNSISPLSDDFNEKHFENLFKSVGGNMSVKAFLATQQRIPGFGNGVLQDVLICSGIHPKRKTGSLSDSEKEKLLHNIKGVLLDMARLGGRDTEKDLYGNFGGYETILSKNSYKKPCRFCGGEIIKESYLGGAVYYCPSCQKL